MSVFLGIGLGPIQTGIFLSGAEGNFDRLVAAEVDNGIVNAVRQANGKITINIAGNNGIYRRSISGIEIYNPLIKNDLDKLINAAADADEISTALPSVFAFAKIAEWLRMGFERSSGKGRFIYAAENHNRAAEILEEKLDGKYSSAYFLNTVIGKMSGALCLEDCSMRDLAPLCGGAGRGHIVEEFNKILISDCPGIDERKVSGLIVKKNLLPYEEAKLYGHNAVHFLLGMHASLSNLRYMHELSGHFEIISRGMQAFVEESGTALLKKWRKEEDFFDLAGFRNYAEDLVKRMLNPFLADSVERVCRDIERKLGWDDRIIGTIRLCSSQSVPCPQFGYCARIASEKLCNTSDNCEIRKSLSRLWGDVPPDEKEAVLDIILRD